MPSILIPDVSPQKDEDFFAKARRVVGDGGGFVVKAFDTAALESAFAAMKDPVRLTAMQDNRAGLRLPNGAENTAALLMRYVQQLRRE